MDILLIITFIISAGLIVYHHVGYPLFLRWYANRHPLETLKHETRGFKSQQTDRTLPSVTILVPAYNEQEWIAQKIRNLASLDYPKKQLNIRIVCDGCSDNTVQIAEEVIQEAICADTHFEIVDCSNNRGKVAVINEQMLTTTSDITAISDVSALISVDALVLMAQHFKNQSIGVVNAKYCLLSNTDEAEGHYWNYQNAIKYRETTLGSTLGSHGALYFFRTHLYQPIAANTINDDFIIPMQIVKAGFLAHYEPNMIAVELEPTTQGNDFKRRLRISAGNMQQLIFLFALLNPKFKGVAFAFFSGKGLRLMTPYLLIACWGTSLMLVSNPIFDLLFVAQSAMYSVAALGYYLPSLRKITVIKLLTYVVAGHTANLIGGLRYLLGFHNKTWTKVSR
ncbi:glycosyltransferase family 2 protein [Vibrio sp. ZSDZ34]|uniref:Glycosyltransferase family 2 protein n=1 Tax=Vibrio gelatinilyticus TaxID=2893468 RepID=A0A9X1W6E7_9VIBR|nr:glycosyltransferase family 2 protein [Vibrio gelatinilyticus]MCJ2375347.1 glycosyltransferase family 2 protein [Vibrio gelatinilyticus]